MKLYEKIRLIRKDKGLKLTKVYQNIKRVFGDKSVTYRTLQRIEAGEPGGKLSSLHQFCMGLGITYQDLIKDTEEESAIHTKPKNREGRYYYDKNSYAEILTSPNESFMNFLFVLKPNGKTKLDKDPDGEIKYRKWLFMLKGSLLCVLKDKEEKKFVLKKNDCFSFDSRIAHYLENQSKKEAHCILMQFPRHI